MVRRLPPLKALCAFEAAARHRSFTRAAQELGVTQGAISKQIALLENSLNVHLLERGKRQVTLSREGEGYLPSVAAALDMIAQATDEIAHGQSRRELLTINILPSLSSRWLIPLLDDFRHSHPHIRVKLAIGDGPIDFAASDADIAIRAARSNLWKRLHAEPIMGEELLPVLSPALKLSTPLESPADLARHTLLQHTSRPDMWPQYLRAMGIRNPKMKYDLGFEHFFMLIQAAADGLGVALIPRFLIAKELKERSLEVAFTRPYQSPYRYYFVCPRHTLDQKKICLFRDWLKRITRTDEARR